MSDHVPEDLEIHGFCIFVELLVESSMKLCVLIKLSGE